MVFFNEAGGVFGIDVFPVVQVTQFMKNNIQRISLGNEGINIDVVFIDIIISTPKTRIYEVALVCPMAPSNFCCFSYLLKECIAIFFPSFFHCGCFF